MQLRFEHSAELSAPSKLSFALAAAIILLVSRCHTHTSSSLSYRSVVSYRPSFLLMASETEVVGPPIDNADRDKEALQYYTARVALMDQVIKLRPNAPGTICWQAGGLTREPRTCAHIARVLCVCVWRRHSRSDRSARHHGLRLPQLRAVGRHARAAACAHRAPCRGHPLPRRRLWLGRRVRLGDAPLRRANCRGTIRHAHTCEPEREYEHPQSLTLSVSRAGVRLRSYACIARGRASSRPRPRVLDGRHLRASVVRAGAGGVARPHRVLRRLHPPAQPRARRAGHAQHVRHAEARWYVVHRLQHGRLQPPGGRSQPPEEPAVRATVCSWAKHARFAHSTFPASREEFEKLLGAVPSYLYCGYKFVRALACLLACSLAWPN